MVQLVGFLEDRCHLFAAPHGDAFEGEVEDCTNDGLAYVQYSDALSNIVQVTFVR